MARVTLQTVADRAGVSIATVSKVFHGRADVSAPTRVRVMEAAASAGYVQRPREDLGTPVVLVMFDRMQTMYSATILDGIVEGGGGLGVEIAIRFVDHTKSGSDRLGLDLPSRCAGAVFVTMASDLLQDFYAAHPALPAVALDPNRAAAKAMTIGSTNWSGGRAATEHLLSLGHTQVGWIGGPANAISSVDRYDGYIAALRAAGIERNPRFERNGAYTAEFGRETATQLLATDDRPTAIVAANDEIALGVLEAARDLRIVVPEDLSVVGFDDTPQALWSVPALTTVRQPLNDMGKLAISMIISASHGVLPESRHMQLQTKLIVRDSTAPLQRAATERCEHAAD